MIPGSGTRNTAGLYIHVPFCSFGCPYCDFAVSRLKSGEVRAWDWKQSGIVEMNCFLCHWSQPNNQARIRYLKAGKFAWANTATLLGTGIVEETPEGLRYNPAAFQPDGTLKPEKLAVQAPSEAHCAACHGYVQTDRTKPVVAPVGDLTAWETATTGQVFSGDKINESGMNIQGKERLNRAWDIHLERDLTCRNCHYSINNPIYLQKADQPSYLLFDPRRPDFAEYLYRPSHDFARGRSAQYTVAPEWRGSMRRCEQCHSIQATHNWLPYKYRHMQQIGCETCHIPKLYAPAVQHVDWTVLTPEGQPVRSWRGFQGQDTVHDLVQGYRPVLLPREEPDGHTRLLPYNLVTAWYWVYGDPPRPVPKWALERLFFTQEGQYRPEIVRLLDANRDGQLSREEIRLTTQEQVKALAARLAEMGFPKARIMGEIQPYSIAHDVAAAGFATKECQACHGPDSRLTQPIALAPYVPGGVEPDLRLGADIRWQGTLRTDAAGRLYFVPQVEHLYIFGKSRVPWIDWLGLAAMVGVLLGVAVHGGLRIYSARKGLMQTHEVALRKVYMYTLYERIWHWVQALAILLLLLTGFIIHRPETLGRFVPYRFLVYTHNALAVLLLLDAGLALFYHLATGEIRQFLPRPRGFFHQAILQARYYLYGIFRGEPHPFEKRPDRKLNPLQQATYFVLLNVMLPVQIVTGLLMWLAQYRPDWVDRIGGLRVLAPIHTLFAWLFAAFIVMHIYLTTTGPKPTTFLKAMITGWEEVETPAHETSEHARA